MTGTPLVSRWCRSLAAGCGIFLSTLKSFLFRQLATKLFQPNLARSLVSLATNLPRSCGTGAGAMERAFFVGGVLGGAVGMMLGVAAKLDVEDVEVEGAKAIDFAKRDLGG